jgi:hypothetical protein
MEYWNAWWKSLPETLQRFLASDLASWGALVAAVVVLFLTWWWRPRTKLLLHPSHWKAHRDTSGIYILGHVHASTPNAVFATQELVFTVLLPDTKPLDIYPEDMSKLNSMDFGGSSSQFMFRLPDYGTFQRITSIPVEIRVTLTNGTNKKMKFSLDIPN